MGRNTFSIVAIFVVVIAAFFTIFYYLWSNQKVEEIATHESDTADIQKHLKEEKKPFENEQNRGQEPEHKRAAQENNLDTGSLNDANSKENKKAQRPPSEAPMNSPPSEPKGQQNNNSEQAKAMEQSIQKQIAVVYDDLFKELSLPEEQQKKLISHLSKSVKSEAELGPKIMDARVPVEDILRQQEKLSQEQSGNLASFLSPREQDLVKQYQQELPKKMQKDHFTELVDSLGFSGAEKDNAQRVIDRAIDRMEPQKGIGEMSKQDIIDMRAKLGSDRKTAMKAMIEMNETETKNFLKNIEELPREQYEKIKEQIEMPIKMMQEDYMRQQPPGAP